MTGTPTGSLLCIDDIGTTAVMIVQQLLASDTGALSLPELHARGDRKKSELIDYLSSLASHDPPGSRLARVMRRGGAVFDLDEVDWSGRRPNFGDHTNTLIHADWFQQNQFEGYLVKPEGNEPPERPGGDVKDHRVVAT